MSASKSCSYSLMWSRKYVYTFVPGGIRNPSVAAFSPSEKKTSIRLQDQIRLTKIEHFEKSAVAEHLTITNNGILYTDTNVFCRCEGKSGRPFTFIKNKTY